MYLRLMSYRYVEEHCLDRIFFCQFLLLIQLTISKIINGKLTILKKTSTKTIVVFNCLALFLASDCYSFMKYLFLMSMKGITIPDSTTVIQVVIINPY